MEAGVAVENANIEDVEALVVELHSLQYLMGPVAENVMSFLKRIVWDNFIYSSKAMGYFKEHFKLSALLK